jgi:hypothetical protein
MVSRTYDLETRRFVELFEDFSFPWCDPGSRAFTDGLATVSMVVAPVQYYLKYLPSNLVKISIVMLQNEQSVEPPVLAQ